MKADYVDEPELQFADGEHVDIRAGIAELGALDRAATFVPRPIRLGIVGSTASVDGVRSWLQQCADGVASAEQRLRDLRPDFPGMTAANFGTFLELNDATVRGVSAREIDHALCTPDVRAVVEVFAEHARDVTEGGRVDVVVIAPPADVFAHSDPKPAGEQELDEGSEDKPTAYVASFHDVFKARALDLSVPCQLVRPDTYGGGRTRGTRRRASLQDESTRAWNFHTALYYKAVQVAVRAELDDAGLLRAFGGAGRGVFPVRATLRAEVEDLHDLQLVGRCKGVRERYYAVTTDRRIRHPALAAVVDRARADLYLPRPARRGS